MPNLSYKYDFHLLKKMDDHILILLKSNLFKNGLFDPQALKVFNKYMLIPILLAALYFVLDMILVNPYRNAASMIFKVSGSSAVSPLSQERPIPVETKSYSHYSGVISNKSIFGAAAYNQAETEAETDEVSNENLGLVGIIAGDSPQAIIEDKKSQKTYYLTKGQSFNGITVEAINEDKVLLDYKGKRISLLL